MLRLQTDKWNRRESLETDQLTYGNVICERDDNSKLWCRIDYAGKLVIHMEK